MLSRRTESFDTEKNYWEIFPEVKHHPAFSLVYKKDKAKKKDKSSRTMWALHLVCHPKSLMYYDPNKLENVKGLLPNDWDWESDSESSMLETYRGMMLTEAQRALTDWDDMIKKRSSYLKNQEYNLENGKELDQLHKNTYNIYKDYQKICEELTTEENSNINSVSLSESGEI
mgnify:CR=1 FL=1|tara:strand:- start:293 stop:808 length:516 start_codon:yes stop_codon:yes gene_type:complete